MCSSAVMSSKGFEGLPAHVMLLPGRMLMWFVWRRGMLRERSPVSMMYRPIRRIPSLVEYCSVSVPPPCTAMRFCMLVPKATSSLAVGAMAIARSMAKELVVRLLRVGGVVTESVAQPTKVAMLPSWLFVVRIAFL